MDSFELSCNFPVSASKVYTAWLDSEQHSNFTGGMSAIESKINSFFTAWDGYITGKILEFEPETRILHHWRTTEFPPDAESSLLEVSFTDVDGQCLLTLKHSNIPNGQGSQYEKGWDTHYFVPMKEYFSSLAQ